MCDCPSGATLSQQWPRYSTIVRGKQVSCQDVSSRHYSMLPMAVNFPLTGENMLCYSAWRTTQMACRGRGSGRDERPPGELCGQGSCFFLRAAPGSSGPIPRRPSSITLIPLGKYATIDRHPRPDPLPSRERELRGREGRQTWAKRASTKRKTIWRY